MSAERIYPEVVELVGVDINKFHAMGGAYDGADRANRDIATWQPVLRSADVDISEVKSMADARTRDAYRNDAYTMGGMNYSRDSIVGGMFLLNSKPDWAVLGLDEAWAEEFSNEVEAKFTLWAESANNWVDAARMNTLTSMVRMAIGIYGLAGEVVATAEWLRDGGASRPFKTAIQMIDLDRLCNPFGQMNDKYLRNGIVKNDFGAPQGYWFRMAHPNSFYDPDSWKWNYVPVRKPWGRMQVIHIVEQSRADQSRGISDLVSSLKEHRMTKRFRDVVLQNAVVNSSYAASIESELPSEAVFASLGGGQGGSVGDAITGYAENYFGVINEYAGSAKNLVLDGVKIPHLFPGTKLNLHPAGKGGPLGTDFENSLLRYLSAALGISYEEFSNDYSKSNYSSIRAAMGKTWKTMMSRKRMVADRFANQVFALWLEEAINAGKITSLPKNAPSFYEGLNKEAYCACEWVGSSRGQIDELKETQAAALRIRENLSTREEELGRLGKDWRKVFAQLAREKREMTRLDIEPVASASSNALQSANNPDAAQPDSAATKAMVADHEDRLSEIEAKDQSE